MNFCRPRLIAFLTGLTLSTTVSFAAGSASDVEAVISDSAPGTMVAAVRRKAKKREVQQQEEEVVDLSAEDSGTATTEASSPSNMGPHGGATGTEPHFSVMFDLLMGYRPNKEGFSFLNFHPLLFFEIVPSSSFIFSFEVNPNPRYYELDWIANKTVTLRVGRIWIPFDDMNPHNLFGGMVSTSRMQFGSTQYMPDIFADLGVGIKLGLVDSKALKLEGHFYVVNGFRASGSPPGPTNPNFSATPDFTSSDNNDNKSVGTRFHALISRVFGFGVSAYYGRWSDNKDTINDLLILGGDVQLRFPKTEIRAGVSTMTVGYTGGRSGYNRNGNYVELQQKFGERDEWRLIGRFGTQDTNTTVVDDSDNTLLGGGIRWKPNFITLSLEHYQDLRKVPAKVAYGFSFLRMVVQL